MRWLHFVEIENFKRFGQHQRIELDHPAVLIGPNNCGKTTAIQALALWSQALREWFAARQNSSATERISTPLNRLNIVAVPVQRTRLFWHNTHVRLGNKDIPLRITVGVEHRGKVVPISMRFRNQGDELVYCQPEGNIRNDLGLLAKAAAIRVELLYPMSGLETEEALLQPGRIDVLLGQGQTAQVLRNLCLAVHRAAPQDWVRICELMTRLFDATLMEPQETARGSIELKYRQRSAKEAFDVSSSGRGFQQMLLIFAYLYSHKSSVLLIDEPDAHLEILRQKQVYVLLRDIASANRSQVILITHSEVILDEALDTHLTLLLDGRADDLANKRDIRNSLKHFGTSHYLKARERGYLLYVEGSTDIDMLRAFAERLEHPVVDTWDERINVFYVQNNYPSQHLDAELERVEGGFGVTPRDHFNGLRSLLPGLRGLAILDNDGRPRSQQSMASDPALKIAFWKRYEIENYFVSPALLREFASSHYREDDLFESRRQSVIDQVLDRLLLDDIFGGIEADLAAWREAGDHAARLLWEAKTERIKLSEFAENFFRRLAQHLGEPLLLRKGEFHRLVKLVPIQSVPAEVREKLNLLQDVFQNAAPI
jgi:hypothetical protein